MRRVSRTPSKQMALHVVVRGHERQVNPVDILLVKDLDDVVSMAFDWSRVRRGCLMR